MNKIWTGWAIPDGRKLSRTDRLAWLVGSGFGSGFSPLAPGTAGSAMAGAIFYAIMLVLPEPWPLFLPVLAVGLLAVAAFPVGVWATGRMATDTDPDPGAAVWDEFVGMWITCLPTALFPEPPLALGIGVVASFLVFRAFDTMKPWPCRQLERLHGGWGIMLDDVAAALWGGLAWFILSMALTICAAGAID